PAAPHRCRRASSDPPSGRRPAVYLAGLMVKWSTVTSAMEPSLCDVQHMPTYGIGAKFLNFARSPPPESSLVASPMGFQSRAAGVLSPSAKSPMTEVTLSFVLATSRPQTGRVVLSPLLWLISEFVGRASSFSRRLNCIVLAAERTAITMREPGSS